MKKSNGYILIETTIAFALTIVVVHALFALASHVTTLRMNIDRDIVQAKKYQCDESTQFSFNQTNISSETKGFSTVVMSQMKTKRHV